MSKIIYLATPYTHKSKDVVEQRYILTANKCAELISEGNVVISPIFYGHNLLKFRDMPGDWEFWKNFCESFLYKSDELWVYKIEGWDQSTGLQSEIDLAKKLNIPIRYIDLD